MGLPPPDALDALAHETGWGFEVHGPWLLTYRLRPTPTPPEDIARVIAEGLETSRRLLGAGVR